MISEFVYVINFFQSIHFCVKKMKIKETTVTSSDFEYH